MPNQLRPGPGNAGKKLPIIPTITQMNPRINSNISINFFSLLLNPKYSYFLKLNWFTLKMKRILPFVLLSSMYSCQYFEKNVPNKDELLNQEIKKIDWENVDEFPSLAVCDSLDTKEAKKECFFELLTQNLEVKLSNDDMKKQFPNLDTLQLKVTVFPDYTVEFSAQNTSEDVVKLDSVIKSKAVDLPIVEPAIKRGIKVKSEFILPVVIKK